MPVSGNRRIQIRSRKMCIRDRLLPAIVKAGGHGRVATSEVLINTPAVANLIAMGKSSQIYSNMETGRNVGMQTLEQDVARLWVTGRITEHTAIASCKNVGVMKELSLIHISGCLGFGVD